MEKSLYFQYVQKYFPQLILAIVNKLNDSTRPLTYLYRNALRPRFSVDGRWATITGNYTRVAADVVAMDSPLPLIKRDSLEAASGFIPKMGLKLFLNEKQMSDIEAMLASGTPVDQVINVIFEDTPKVIEAIYERIEYMFLLGLSTGVALASGAEGNRAVGTRLNFGFKTENTFGVKALWSDAEACKPFDDIKRIMDKAEVDGNTVIRVYADDAWIDAACASQQVRNYFAFALNSTVANTAIIPILDREQLNTVLQRKYGITLVRVNRSVRTEKNGVQTTVKPWKQGSATFVCDEQVGDLVWTNLAEASHPVAGVTYQTADQFILVSKYRDNDPLREYTSSQARVVPVIANVDRIYTLDTKTVQA